MPFISPDQCEMFWNYKEVTLSKECFASLFRGDARECILEVIRPGQTWTVLVPLKGLDGTYEFQEVNCFVVPFGNVNGDYVTFVRSRMLI